MINLLSASLLVLAAAFAQGLVTFGPIELLVAPVVLGTGAVLAFFKLTRRIGAYLVIAGSLAGTLWASLIFYSFWNSDALKLGIACLLLAVLSNLVAYKLYRHTTPSRSG